MQYRFAVFGGTALYIEDQGAGGLVEPVMENVAMSLHVLLEHLPWTSLIQWVGLVLAVIFFITSSDSGSFVDDMVTSGGNPNPPVANRIFWGISEGAAAAVLLVAGGLQALQAVSISAGLPQSVLLLLACVGLVKTLRAESLSCRYKSMACASNKTGANAKLSHLIYFYTSFNLQPLIDNISIRLMVFFASLIIFCFNKKGPMKGGIQNAGSSSQYN
jgi:choline-glycine betaine transporter